MDPPDFTESSVSDLATVSTAPALQQAPATEAVTFFNLPRELRDLIYAHLFEAEYTQIRVDAYLRNLRLDQVDGGQTKPSDRLAVMQASRNLWEEGSRIFYGENLFRFHIGSTIYNTTLLLTRRTADLMQDIEISLYPTQTLASVRILQLFSTSQILRKSCLIKLQFRKIELMNDNTLETLKQMTGFKVLIFEVNVPRVTSTRYQEAPELEAPIPWVSGLLASIKNTLTMAMGPSTFANDRHCRRLIFNPQDPKG